MDEDNIMALFDQVHVLIKEAKSKSNNTQLFIESLSQLDGITHSILKGDCNKVLTQRWRLEALVTMETEIDECLGILKENGAIESVMHDLFVHIMNVFYQTFDFCHLAGKICSDQPEEVTEKLSSLFRLSYQNIKVLMDAVETFQNVFSDDASYLHEVFVNLIKCSQILADIDIMASVAVWKSIKRLFLLHRGVVGNNPLKFHCLFDLCEITCNTLGVCFDLLEKKDNVTNNRYQKVIRFFLGIILLLTEDFKEVVTRDMGCKVYKLVHTIQKLSLIETRKDFETRGCSAEYDFLYNSLLCVNDPLMKNFVQTSCSAQCIMGRNLDNNMNGKYEELIYLLVVINVVECLTEQTQFITPWMTPCVDTSEDIQPHHSLLHVIFSCVEQCSSSLFAQRKDYAVVDKSKCLKETSLYQIVLGKLCAFVITLGPNYFTDLEKVMLSNVLHGSKYCFLLASDLWCFISRWGKAELCLDYFIFLGKLLVHLYDSKSDDVAISNIFSLLQRLFWILEDNQHEKIVENFPITPSNVVIWRLIPLSHVNITNKNNICSQIVEIFLSLTDEKREKNENGQRQIISSIQCLSNLLSSDVYSNVDDTVKQHVNEHIYLFWSRFSHVEECIEVNELLITTMLDLTSKLLVHLEGKYIYKILSIINSVLQNNDNQAFQLQCTHLLMCLKDITFQSEIESDCLLILSKMSQFLMTQADWIIEDSSMKALQRFAQETTYSRALVTFLPMSKKKDFTSYLKKESCAIDLHDGDLINIVLKYISRDFSKQTNQTDTEGTLYAVIDKIEEDAKELNKLMQEQSLPPGFLERVTNIISLLESSCR